MTTDREALAELVAELQRIRNLHWTHWSREDSDRTARAIAAARARLALPEAVQFQQRMREWAVACFGESIVDRWNVTSGLRFEKAIDVIRAKQAAKPKGALPAAQAPEPSMSMFASKDDLIEARGNVSLIEIVNKQAEDDGLWFRAQTASEAYLQQELRKLHHAIEVAPQINAPAPETERARWIAICKDHAADTTPSRKPFDNYLDGWLDACNEIMWAGEADPINAPAGTPAKDEA